jgi:hypothetical protein
MSDLLPRWLTASEAARHVGTETEGFRRAVRRGILPPASYKLGPQSPRWDRHALDQAMGGEGGASGMEESVNALVQAKGQPPKNRPEAPR